MPRYIVKRAYQSDVATYAAGQVIEIDAELAAWFNRDLPGVLQLIEPPAAQPVERHMIETPAPGVEVHMVESSPPRKRRRGSA